MNTFFLDNAKIELKLQEVQEDEDSQGFVYSNPTPIELNISYLDNNFVIKGKLIREVENEDIYFTGFNRNISLLGLTEYYFRNKGHFDVLEIFSDWLEENNYNEVDIKFREQFGVNK